MMNGRGRKMPTIARIRFANVVYENRQKRYNDEIFNFDGHNGALLLENGGGKTVFIQTLLQAVIPHLSLTGRKIKDTLVLAQSPAHIAVEWILHEQPRVYGLTVVTLLLKNEELHSYKYTYRYTPDDKHNITQLPFTVSDALGRPRPATAEEMHDYYVRMNERLVSAKFFSDITDYVKYLETDFKLVNDEWTSLATINSGEGDVAKFFEACKTTNDLVNKLLIPTVLLGIKGEDKASFTQLFEEKRTNLRKSKQLKRQIQENQAVEAEIGKMMGVYQEQHLQEERHYALQQQGKGFYEAGQQTKEQLTAELILLESQQRTLEEENRLLYEQQESLVIAEGRLVEEQAYAAYGVQQVNHQECYERLATMEREKDILDYLRDKQDRDTKGAQIAEEEASLARQATQQDQELLAELAVVHCQLRGIFDDKESVYRQNLAEAIVQRDRITTEIQEQAAGIEKLDGLRQRHEQEEVKQQTVIHLLSSEQDKIALQILSNSSEQQVGTELVKWKQEATYVQKSLAEQMQQKNIAEQGQLDKRQQVTVLTAQVAAAELELEKTTSRLAENHRRHAGVLAKLRQIPSLRNLDSIYVDQGKVDAALGILQDRRQKELEVAREEERRDFRLVDAYGGQEQFTFDSYVAGFLEKCNCIVESGTAYTERLIQQGYGTREELLAHFPLWPMCVVVQEGDKAELERKLCKVSSSLTSPVFILTTTEARAAVDGSYPQATIYPEFWPSVLERQSFATWQGLFHEKAQQSRVVRVEKEELYREVAILYGKLDEFLLEYPQADILAWQQDKNRLQDEIAELKRRITIAKQEEQGAIKAAKLCQETIANLEGKANDLNGKIEKAQEWQHKDHACQLAKTALAQCQRERNQVLAKLALLKPEQQRSIGQEGEYNRKITTWELQLGNLVREELYKTLRPFSPVATLLTEEALIAKRLRLKEELAHSNRSREVIENRIKTYRNEWEKFDRRLQGYDLQVPDDRVFPPAGAIQLMNLQRDLAQLKPEVKKQGDKLQELHNRWQQAKTRREEREKFYLEKTSTHIHVFAEMLDVVKERLTRESTRVAHELAVNMKQSAQLATKQNHWSTLCAELETSNGKLEFLAEHIPSRSLTSDEETAFPYQSRSMVAKVLEELRKSQEQLAARKNAVERGKTNFENFCQSKNFQNEKMRQNVLNGIRQRHSYSQMLTWEQELKRSIQAANTVAEHNMQAYNEDIKHFINQLHLHLVSICDEILIIQKMTSVKVEDHYKTIYEIKTPHWEENTAKEKLMDHLEWMTDQLAADSYKQEDGLEDGKKIRKNIERWLSPSYLFTRISPNKGFTVGVRKVSNDNRISNYPMDWATSNSWSGGEKWSKNMALFLGIQSYLSEKRQPLTFGRRNIRTVVLDNPFGQASSDHVLAPVFFIAEKLGFQVIALTALAEGKFLRDYFPIIYSCRLRPAAGGETAIMDKELHINHAFFQDHAPQSLTRINQITQIQLLS